MERPRLLRITTVPISLDLLLKGQFRFMTGNGFDVLTASADGPEVKNVIQEGVEHVVVPFTRRITPFRDLLCLWKLVGLMQTFRPTIVHTHTPKAGLLGMMAAWIAGVPVRLHTVAGLPFMEASGMKSWLLRQTEKTTYHLAHRVYPNSHGLKEIMAARLKATGPKFKVIARGSSNGIDASFFQRTPAMVMESQNIRKRFQIQQNEFVFNFVGRIVRDKGIIELISAFEQLGRDRKVRLLVVGHFEEDLDPLPQTTMQFLQTDSRVVLAGFQSDVRPWLMASDVFVLPSYREGFPNVVMQACALEVPCIVSDINGCNELIQRGETGIIMPPKNIAALENAMRQLMDRADRKLMGTIAREFVVKNFDQGYFWDELLKEYQSFL